MNKRLSKHGNSLALIIDKPILDLLNITENTVLKIKTDGSNIVIQPIEASAQISEKVSDDEAVQKSFEEVLKAYAPALKKLSE